MEPRQRRFSIRYTIVTIVAILAIESYLFAPHPETLAYSDFIKLLNAGKVSDLTLSKQTIRGSLAANGLRNIEDRLESLLRHLQTVHVMKDGNAVGNFKLRAHGHDQDMRRILTLPLIHQNGLRPREAMPVSDALQINKRVLNAVLVSQQKSR